MIHRHTKGDYHYEIQKCDYTARENVKQLDYLLMQQSYKNRCQAIEEAESEKLDRLKRDRLARECAQLNPVEEQELADEGFVEGADNWPENRGVKSAGPI